MRITDDIRYVGVDDHALDLFEGLYDVPNGVSYNSYVIMDEKIAVMDAVDAHFGGLWLDNVRKVLDGRQPDFLIVHHMEPDHSASIALFMSAFPEAIIVSSAKAFPMMTAFFGEDYPRRRIIVKEGDQINLGQHVLSFIAAPMVHWPEVIMTYDRTDKVVFSADAFGKFGVPASGDAWANEAGRYYFSIVGKYGTQTQAALKKLAALDIQHICPLHGPVLAGDEMQRAFQLYETWSSYRPEERGVTITHASVYGNTREAAFRLAAALESQGIKVVIHDLTREDASYALADAFRFDRLVLAAATYNADVFPPMKNFLHSLTERGYHGRTVGLIENGSWAPMAGKVMRTAMEGCKDVTILEPMVSIRSALNEESIAQLNALADALV